MKKKIVMALSALALAGWATGALAAKTGTSPFTDNLTLTLNGFPTGTIFVASYVDNNGVNISGPAFFNTDAPTLVKIYSDNKAENGNPNMTMQYPTIFGTQSCTLNFVDGPWTVLNYKNGSAPVCAGITVGSITSVSQDNYTLTITDNEP